MLGPAPRVSRVAFPTCAEEKKKAQCERLCLRLWWAPMALSACVTTGPTDSARAWLGWPPTVWRKLGRPTSARPRRIGCTRSP